MALRFVEPPPQVLATYRDSLRDLGSQSEGEIALYHLPVGALTLEDLAAADALDHVHGSGCRFIANWPDGTWLSCELTDPTLYGEAAFRNIVRVDPVLAVAQRIEVARRLPAVQEADYELRFLNIPGLLLEALHLRSKASGAHLIMPIASCHEELPPGAVFTGPNFLAAASPLAAAQLAHGAAHLSS